MDTIDPLGSAIAWQAFSIFASFISLYMVHVVVAAAVGKSTVHDLFRVVALNRKLYCMVRSVSKRGVPFLPSILLQNTNKNSQTQHDPETARLARLAALEGRGAAGGRGAQGQRGRDESATPLLVANDHDVLTLQVRTNFCLLFFHVRVLGVRSIERAARQLLLLSKSTCERARHVMRAFYIVCLLSLVGSWGFDLETGAMVLQVLVVVRASLVFGSTVRSASMAVPRTGWRIHRFGAWVRLCCGRHL